MPQDSFDSGGTYRGKFGKLTIHWRAPRMVNRSASRIRLTTAIQVANDLDFQAIMLQVRTINKDKLPLIARLSRQARTIIDPILAGISPDNDDPRDPSMDFQVAWDTLNGEWIEITYDHLTVTLLQDNVVEISTTQTVIRN